MIIFKKCTLSTTSPSFIMIGMMTRVKQENPKCESILFQPVLKAYPAQHSWIITAHVSIGDLNKQLCMFNCQRKIAQELLIKLQQQLFASNFMFNALLREFSNIENIYQSYEPAIQTTIQQLRNEPVTNKSSKFNLTTQNPKGASSYLSWEMHYIG